MLDGDKRAKIGDFGLARTANEYNFNDGANPVPWRWTSPEAFTKKEYSEKSDVWSFGVVLFEIFSLGTMPYAGKNDAGKLMKKLKNDGQYRLEMPDDVNFKVDCHSRAIHNVRPKKSL